MSLPGVPPIIGRLYYNLRTLSPKPSEAVCYRIGASSFNVRATLNPCERSSQSTLDYLFLHIEDKQANDAHPITDASQSLGLPAETQDVVQSGDVLAYVFQRASVGVQRILGRRDWLTTRLTGTKDVLSVHDAGELVPRRISLQVKEGDLFGCAVFRPTDGLDRLYQDIFQRVVTAPLVEEWEASKRTVAVIFLGAVSGYPNYALRRFLFSAAAGLDLQLVVVDKPDHWLLSEEAVALTEMRDYERPYAFVPFDFTDMSTFKPRMIACLRNWEESSGVKLDGVTTFKDPFLVPVAEVALAMGLAANDVEATRLCLDKLAMRKVLPWNGQIAHAICSRTDIEQALNHGLTFPVIFKPRSGGGSVNVYKVLSKDELYDLWDTVHAQHPALEAIVEVFVEGFEVDLMIVLEKGRLVHCDISDNSPTRGDQSDHVEDPTQRTFLEPTMSWPSVLPDAVQNRVREVCYASMLSLGLHDASGTYNVEARVCIPPSGTKDTNPASIPVFIIEVNARPGGTNSPDIVQRMYGVDEVACNYLAALGRPLAPAIQGFPRPFGYGCRRLVIGLRSGVIANDPLERVRERPDLTQYLVSMFTWPKGYRYVSNGQLLLASFFIVSLESWDDLMRKADEIEALVDAKFEEDGEVQIL